MSYSIDLRERAVKYKIAGHTLKETSKIFGIGETALSKWIKKYRESGDLSNKKLERKAKKLPPEKLKKYVEEHPDAYQREIAKFFNCSPTAVYKAFKRLKITRKKRHLDIRNKIKNL